ncbi:hypothetical protein SPI_06373 [Niveomyces insectorum RCEF 264]|uniref:F-box domain-containing protein n=1 Tax=Niveomyces insectorum RCEF 264 TaxID=1081102 RepID=A0A167S2Q9_9HYPO|nr:hypothetical protein SPI_06373 [Niveomyces insectorum RCEF 264]
MDLFARLPPELLLPILKDVSDLSSLHSLRCASPAVARFFWDDDLAVEIIEAVLVKSVAEKPRKVVRATCRLLARPPASWDAFLEAWPRRRSVDDAPLPSGDRVVVHAAAVLRPRRPVNPLFSWRKTQPLPVPDEPAEIDPTAAAPPLLWVEAQRALFGAWQLAFYSVLRDALWEARTDDVADAGPDHNGDDDEGPLHSPLHLWRAMENTHNFGPKAYLETMVEADDDDRDKPLVLPSGTPPCRRLADAFPDAPSPWGTGAVSDYTVDVLPMPANWQPGPTGFGDLHRGTLFMYQLRAVYWSPLYRTTLAPFRKRGFYLWEKSRMERLGLLTSDESTRFWGLRQTAEYSDVYAWYSLVTAEKQNDEAAAAPEGLS